VALRLCRGSWPAEADLTLQQLMHKGWTVADGAPGNIVAIAQTTVVHYGEHEGLLVGSVPEMKMRDI
jgi:hypothetical protein